MVQFLRESSKVLPSIWHWLLVALLAVFAYWSTQRYPAGWVQWSWPILTYALARHQQETGETAF